MKKFKFLLAAAALMIGGSVSAQTDVTSTYITNADFESATYTTPYRPNGDRDITQPEGWTLTYTNGVSYDSSILKASQATYSNISGQVSIPGDGRGDQTYAVRFHNNGKTQMITLAQAAQVLPAGYYTISGLFRTQNQNELEVGFFFGEYSTETRVKYEDGNAAWKTLSYDFESDGIAETTIGLFFKHTSGNQMVAGVDNITLTYTPYVVPTAITLDNTSWTTIPTSKKTLSITSYTPAEVNHDKEITWTSSNEAVATVSSDGVVTAVAAGTATITATTANSISATCAVTVNPAPLADGDYYILNVSKDKYLSTLKSGWGTQAAIADHGIPFTATLANGAYTLDSHTYNKASQHFLNGTYVDGDATSLYITSLGSGKYSISTADGSAYLTANNDDAVVANTAANADNELAQWKFITKAELEADLSSAKLASPKDATFYIGDPDFSRNLILQLLQNGQTTKNPGNETYPWNYTVSNYHFKGGDNGNMNAESYHSTGTVTQTLSVPNGQYVVKCQAFQRKDDGATDDSYLTANVEKEPLSIFNGNGEGTAASMTGASTSFSAGLYQNQVTVDVTDGTLTIGAQGTAHNWTIFDNFELYYYGPNIAEGATVIAMDTETAMTADKWYYFDIAVDGEYDFTLTTLADIVYTTNGAVLVENEGDVTANFSGTEAIGLTAGRYFVKSTSAQTFSVAAHSYTYELGDATLSVADGSYIQSGTFTVTYPSAATNDPEAVDTEALVASSTATVNGNTVDLVATAKGFTLDLGTLTANTDYVIAIPANVYGYAGESMNNAINVTLHTPALFDGEYIFYDATCNLFLGRGCAWGTEATLDKYGVPFNLRTDVNGVSSVEFIDWTGVKLFHTDTDGVFTDGASTGWKVIAADGGYKVCYADQTLYLTHAASSLGESVKTTADAASATVWTLKTKSERNAIVNAYPAENKDNVITASGISTDAASFVAYLNANYDAEDMTSWIGTAKFTDGIAERRAATVGDWTWSEVRAQTGSKPWDNSPAYGNDWAEVFQATGKYTQTINASNLPAGIYKLTVDGYERRAGYATDNALGASGYDVTSSYLAANGEQVRLKAWYDVHTAALNGGKSGDAYPNSTGEAVECFNAGYATNELYVYLDGATDLTITLCKPNYMGGSWMCFNNFTLTRYTQTSATMVIAAANQYATFVAPFAVAIPGDVTAYTVDAVVGDALTMTEVTTGAINANTPVVVYSESDVNETFYGKTVAGTPVEGRLTGVYANTDAPVGSYVLQNQSGVVGFYQVEAGTIPNVPANRAYLTTGAGVKAFILNGGDADAIKSVFDGVAAGKIFDLSGRKVAKMQKGNTYIVNGKKVNVK